jgi:hypothetical protein
MAERYTRKDVEEVFATFVDVATRAGFDTEGWHVVIGSKINGNSFRHYTHKWRGVIGTGSCDTEFRSFLGWTCREAYDVLSTRIDTLRATLDMQREQPTYSLADVCNGTGWADGVKFRTVGGE